jgi:hypothetical protein
VGWEQQLQIELSWGGFAGAYKRYRTSRAESFGRAIARAVTPSEPMALSLQKRSVRMRKVEWECKSKW